MANYVPLTSRFNLFFCVVGYAGVRCVCVGGVDIQEAFHKNLNKNDGLLFKNVHKYFAPVLRLPGTFIVLLAPSHPIHPSLAP